MKTTKLNLRRLTLSALMAGLLLTSAASTPAATTNVIFSDPVDNYTVGQSFTSQQAYALPQNAWAIPFNVVTNAGPFNAGVNDQLISFQPTSVNYNNYNSLYVPTASKDPYGQIFLRLGQNRAEAYSFLRFVVSTNNVPNLPSTVTDLDASMNSNANALVYSYIRFDSQGWNICYYGNSSLPFYSTPTYIAPPDDQLFDVTINYNLSNMTFQIWQDNIAVVNNSGIPNYTAYTPNSNGTGVSVGSFEISEAAWDGTTNAVNVLDQWSWATSSDTPFTGPGAFIPEPSGLALAVTCLLGLLCTARRAR